MRFIKEYCSPLLPTIYNNIFFVFIVSLDDTGSGGSGSGGWYRPQTTTTINPFTVPLPLAWLTFYNLTSYEMLDVQVLCNYSLVVA